MLINSNNPAFKRLGQKLTNNSKEALLSTAAIAKKFGYREVSNIHLLYAIYLRSGSVGSNILIDFGLTKEIFQQVLRKYSPKAKNWPEGPVAISEDVKKIITKAFSAAREFGYP